jgi:predicted porin
MSSFFAPKQCLIIGVFMKKSLSVAIALASLSAAGVTHAEISLYGKANVSFESVNEEFVDGDFSGTELVSNASRLGFKGSEKINDSLDVIYQMEYEVTFDDTQTFKQRDIFVGLKGNFGQLLGGNFDTPMKTAQNKVDLFNDLRGDIKNVVTINDVRASNIVEYTTPDVLNGFKAELAFVSAEDEIIDDGSSVALSWANEYFYLAAAVDQDVIPGVEATRLVVQYTLDRLQLGALYEQTDSDEFDDSLTGYAVSAQYKLLQDWVIKAQYGSLDFGTLDDPVDPSVENDTVLSLGADYILSDTMKVFGFYTGESLFDDQLDNRYLGLGLELKF